MNILITGAGGFVGSHLFRKLAANFNVNGLNHVPSENENVFTVNLLDYDETIKLVKERKLKADVIVHLASILANTDNLNDVSIVNSNNLLSYNVAQLAIELKPSVFINISSSSVYPNITGSFDETSCIDPIPNSDAFYGLSKYSGEVIISKLLSKTNMSLIHLRCAMIYGEGVNPSRIWPVMEKELFEKNTITVFGSGERIINQMIVEFFCDAVLRHIAQQIPGVYNVVEESISLSDLAKRIIAAKGNSESKIIMLDKGSREKFILRSKFE